jgi:cytochrome c55X
MSYRKSASRYLSGAGAVLALATFTSLAGSLDSERKNELEYLLRQDCGSCHGMTLNGGLGPALTTTALQDKPRVYLKNTIRDGHPGTPMPPWGGVLSEQDIDYLVEILKPRVTDS